MSSGSMATHSSVADPEYAGTQNVRTICADVAIFRNPSRLTIWPDWAVAPRMELRHIASNPSHSCPNLNSGPSKTRLENGEK